MSEQCVFCGHKHLSSKTTRYIYQKDQQMLVVEHVPCLECTFCGEQYFDAGVLQKSKTTTLLSLTDKDNHSESCRWQLKILPHYLYKTHH